MKDFENFWNTKIKAMAGRSIFTLVNNKENIIEKVTNNYLVRSSSKGKKSHKIPKEIFQEVFIWLKSKQGVTRKEINEKLKGRRSSIISAILIEHENIHHTKNPLKLHWIENPFQIDNTA